MLPVKHLDSIVVPSGVLKIPLIAKISEAPSRMKETARIPIPMKPASPV